MEQQDEHIHQSETVNHDPNAPLTIQPAGSLASIPEQEIRPSSKHQEETYREDDWERAWFHHKVILVFLILTNLIVWGARYAEHPVEFISTSVLAVLVALIGLNQYHVTKRQWFAMRQGLQENRRAIKASKKQARIAKKALKQAEKNRKFAESSFYLAERAYLVIRNVEPQQFIPGSPRNLSPDLDPKFGFEIINGGRTPAFNVSASVHTALGENLSKVERWQQSLIPFRADFLLPNEPHEFTSHDNVKPPEDYGDVWDETYRHFYFVKIVLFYSDISGEPPFKITYIFRYHHNEGVIQWSRETDTSENTQQSD